MKPTVRSNEESFSVILDNVGATDEAIAEGIFEIATTATKTIKDEDDRLVEVPDYTNRGNMFKLLLQAKGHLRPKMEKPDDDSDKIYVFMKK